MAIDPQDFNEELEAEGAPFEAPMFPVPEAIDFDEPEGADIATMVHSLYEDYGVAREAAEQNHLKYDQMFRGQVEEFSTRVGPWEGSSNLHVQMPYWLVDSINARMVHTIWNQNPLVQVEPEEDDDQEKASDVSNLLEWHLQPKRMNARSMWSRASKIRLIHGASVSMMSYVHDKYTFRVADPDEDPQEETVIDPLTGEVMLDEYGLPVVRPAAPIGKIVTGTKYQGPVIHPLEWDEIYTTIDAMNLQPKRPGNPGGADWVIIRQYEVLSLMDSKAEGANPWYYAMHDDGRDAEWWQQNRPDQIRTGDTRSGGQNNERVRAQDLMEGTNRSSAMARSDTERKNPEFEILTYFGPYKHPETGKDEEMVIFVCNKPRIFLGAFLLSDLIWTGERPLVEMHYQTVSNRFWSMGVCEICEHLSEEIDTLHNMRIDVGQATNMPWFFVRASSYIKPSEIELRPLAMIPVDDPRAVVAPQTQNVTSFYYQEEQLLLTLVERVMGVTDLFLGVNAQGGAAARHATGFLGTQQEAEARMSEPLSQDAESFSQMCRLMYAMEMQYGPQERSFRLKGADSSIQRAGLTRDDLWLSGNYDFRLGANVGMFSQHNRLQRAQQAFQMAANSPITNQDMGKRWEAEAEVYQSMGYREKEVERFIGPKSAVTQGNPLSQDEENAQMAQFQFGPGAPAPVHPGDDDQKHISEVEAFLQSDTYLALGMPNREAYMRHNANHYQAMARKQQEQQEAMMAQQQQQQAPQQGSGAADTTNRAAAQLANVGQGGGQQQQQFAATAQSQNGGGGMNGSVAAQQPQGPPMMG